MQETVCSWCHNRSIYNQTLRA